jgi:hypothetical protein
MVTNTNDILLVRNECLFILGQMYFFNTAIFIKFMLDSCSLAKTNTVLSVANMQCNAVSDQC